MTTINACKLNVDDAFIRDGVRYTIVATGMPVPTDEELEEDMTFCTIVALDEQSVQHTFKFHSDASVVVA